MESEDYITILIDVVLLYFKMTDLIAVFREHLHFHSFQIQTYNQSILTRNYMLLITGIDL